MTIALILVAIALLVTAFLFWVTRGQARAIADLQDLPQQTKPVDIAAFRNLIDPGEEQFLRDNLGPRHFRMVQKQRMVAAIAYVRCAAHNAAVLVRLGEAARRSGDPQVALAAQQLVNTAMRLRIYALLALLRLYPAMWVPGARVSPAGVADAYQQLTSVASQLTRLQEPSRAVRISNAL